MKIKMPDKVAAGIAMTQKQKRIKIAEVCNPWNSTNREGSKYTSWADYVNRVCGAIDELPDYFNDLNAMHEAENVLRTNLDYMQLHAWNNYCQHLGFYLTDRNVHDNNCINATSSQRAEAFGKTLNLW